MLKKLSSFAFLISSRNTIGAHFSHSISVFQKKKKGMVRIKMKRAALGVGESFSLL